MAGGQGSTLTQRVSNAPYSLSCLTWAQPLLHPREARSIGCITDDAGAANVAERACDERGDVAQALDTLVGLRAESAEQGGYKYTHRNTGYTFEIRPSEGDATPEYEMLMPGQQELLFIPLDLGHAAQVQDLLCYLILASRAFRCDWNARVVM